MTIKDLKQKIENLPDDMQVFVTKDNPDYASVLAEGAGPQTIDFEHPDGSSEEMDVFIIQDY